MTHLELDVLHLHVMSIHLIEICCLSFWDAGL